MSNQQENLKQLAINGGPKVREAPWPERGLIGVEEKAAVNELFDRSIASGKAFGYGGPEEEAYCRAFAEFMGGGYADAVNSGTNAVFAALHALDPEPFTEIIVGPITDPGGVMPIPMLNCVPVIADAAPGCFVPGPKQIEELITPYTSVIVIAHIFGEPADMEGIMRIARKHKIPVVEDCAQSHYAKLNGKLLGTFGDVAAFSTMFGKHHCAGGQGGIVWTADEELYKKVRRASDRGKPFGLPAGSTNCQASLNCNLNDLAAVIGTVQLKKLPGIVQHRRAVVQKIQEGLPKDSLAVMPPQIKGAEPSYWFLRLRFAAENATCDKKTFCAALAAEGIRVRERYVNPPSYSDWFKNKQVFGTSRLPWSSPSYKGDPNRDFPCPNAMAALDQHFDLPIWESWGAAEAADIVKAITKVSAAYRK